MLEFKAILFNKDNFMNMRFISIDEFEECSKYSSNCQLRDNYSSYLDRYQKERERVAGRTTSVTLYLPASEYQIDEALTQLGIDKFSEESLGNLEIEYFCPFDAYSPPNMRGLSELAFINDTAEFYTSLDIEDDIILAIINYFGEECSNSATILINHDFKIVKKPENEKSIPYKGKYIQLYYED